MNVIDMDIGALIPYGKNPRRNEKAVEYVAKSIEAFGFKVPIVLDKDNVIVAGHTRYMASKKLGLETVPCIIADDLTEDEIKAFRLADNKVSELAEWDEGLLSVELSDLLNSNFDMIEFGFKDDDFMKLPLDDEPPTEEKENERERTMNAYNLHEYDDTRAVGFYQMPMIHRVDYVPERLIGFNYMKSTQPQRGVGVHFFIDDYQFERVWNNPYDYMEMLAQFSCVLTPDFSLYTDMPMAMKIWNVYRSRLIGQMLQDLGAVVIPTLSWCERETFQFCFDGIDKGGTVAVSTIGVKQYDENKQLWIDGMDEALRQTQPKRVLVYGGDIGYQFPCEVVYMQNEVTERMKADGSKEL